MGEPVAKVFVYPEGDDDVDDDNRLVAEALAITLANLTTHAQLDSAREIVQSAMLILDEALCSIKGQMDGAHVRLSVQHPDETWWRRISSARRHKARHRQELQNKFGEINRKLREIKGRAHEASRESAFIRAAELLLPRETYMRLWALVGEIEHGRSDLQPTGTTGHEAESKGRSTAKDDGEHP
jgi:hypothetical protein